MLESPVWQHRLGHWLSPLVWVGLVTSFIACVHYRPPLAMVWQSILIPLILLGTVLRPCSLAGRFLEARPMQWIGRISYSLYLWNSLFFPLMDNPRPLPFGHLQELPWSIFPVFACATVSYYLVERPMIRLGHRLAARIAQPALKRSQCMSETPRRHAA